MKCISVLAYFSCILSVGLSYGNSIVDKAYSEVMYHNQETMKNMRSMLPWNLAGPIYCYDEFANNNGDLLSDFRYNTKACDGNAHYKRESYLTEIDGIKERAEIEERTSQIKNFFDDCSIPKGIDFYNCMSGHVDFGIEAMQDIKAISRSVISSNFNQTAAINDEEQKCLTDAVEIFKSSSDQLLNDLKNCLGN
ncbi:uncharacterized protein LOC129907261 [Episyrphus balteatus]|uniref:uncharacterized protein LOC129907261 n=1 Tax=Episyrphus balteatus TaxID=286459 RepID=UPI0024854D9D|nr:uncharacterized protein LOC129907261 [Episyrphus balteatus]